MKTKTKFRKIATFNNWKEAQEMCLKKNRCQQKPKYSILKLKKNKYVVIEWLLPTEKLEEENRPFEKRSKKGKVLQNLHLIGEKRKNGITWNVIAEELELSVYTCRRYYRKFRKGDF